MRVGVQLRLRIAAEIKMAKANNGTDGDLIVNLGVEFVKLPSLSPLEILNLCLPEL